MLSVLFLCCLAWIRTPVEAAYYEESVAVMIEPHNSEHKTWTAGVNEYFVGKTEEEIGRLMGGRVDPMDHVTMAVERGNASEFYSLPNGFVTGRDKWQACQSTVNYIVDQGSCGSCWAVATAAVISDRTCIDNLNSAAEAPVEYDAYGQQRPSVDFSANQILACCQYCWSGQSGCQGGYPAKAMDYWRNTGVVTGGWFGSNCGCQPYTMNRATHRGPSCQTNCQQGYRKSFNNDKHYANRNYILNGNQNCIMQEIYNRGSVACVFTAYDNFLNYKGGVYSYTKGKNHGGHVVKVIGWGVENGTPYWLINNSWGTGFGENGQVKFRRGINLAGIEQFCVAGTTTNDQNYMLQCY